MGKNMFVIVGTIIGVIGALLVAAAISWGIVAGFLMLIGLCFDIKITAKMITGVWLLTVFIKCMFSSMFKD